ncbi:TlpA disulfide reductase family protein [uncultured Wocania sp.]|uniref:TlpA family protein disulfide reductase n=1 Tax=uncultured Wocania sp. TaxID=2834404 RepID=UPI0030F8B583
MKKTIYLLALVIFSICCKEAPVKENKKVILKGAITNYEQDTLYMKNVSSQFLFFKEIIHPIVLSENKYFNYTFELEKPTYFQIGRTFLYLSPGDSLITDLDTRDRAFASFKGIGAEANNYLRNLPYPKAGSFWGGNDIASKIETYQEMPSAFKNFLDNRMEELDSLSHVSEDFKDLEKARIKFDYVNSLQNLYYLYYKKLGKGEMTNEDFFAKTKEANNYFIPYIKPYLSDFNNTNYLQLEVFQSILYSLKDEEFRRNHELPELDNNLQDYLITADLVNGLRFKGYSNELGDKLKAGVQKVANPDYATVLKELEKEYALITKGNPASDLTFTKLDGSSVKLSDYKGKVIVLDLWATWCGPCMQEKPFFEALEKTYQGNDNVELISLSIDTENVWRDYFKKNEAVGNQLQINRSQLTNYKVAGIPRFFVIDKSFNIVDVFAPLPSSGDLEKLINQYL